MIILTSAIIATSYLTINNETKLIENKVQNLSHIKLEYDQKLNNLKKLSVVMTKVKSLDDIRENLPSNQLQIISSYKHLTKSVPEGIWLEKVDFIFPDQIAIHGKSIDDKRITQFVKDLDSSEDFLQISLKSMEAIKQKTDTLNKTITVKKFLLEGIIKTNQSNVSRELLEGK